MLHIIGYSAVLAACLAAGACAKRPDAEVREYLRLAVALGEREPDSIDYYYGPEDWVADIRAHPPTLAEIGRFAGQLERRIGTSREPRGFLIHQLRALQKRANLAQGKKEPFDQEARDLFGTEPIRGIESSLDLVRSEIDRLLPGPDSLAARYAAFDREFLIPSGRVNVVFERALEACRQRTREHMPLPAGESITVEYTVDQPWNAYSTYHGGFHSRVRVNTDFGLTVDRALQLACHEGYPGHHAANALVDEQLVQREHRWELLVQPTFSPQSFSSEALASYAVDVAFRADERALFERDVLFPLAGISADRSELYAHVNGFMDQLQIAQADIARGYIDGTLEWSRAAAALENRVLMAHSEATLKYLNEYRSYVLAYTQGKEMVRNCFLKRTAESPWQLYQDLILGRVDLGSCAK